MEACIGDWMGSLYDTFGRRWDHALFLDHDGRYERTVRREPDFEQTDRGRWAWQAEEQVIRLEPDAPQPGACLAGSWRVLTVHTCEDSNVMLVLREVILASRNLPILFYRVHSRDRAYGSELQRRAQSVAAPDAGRSQ